MADKGNIKLNEVGNAALDIVRKQLRATNLFKTIIFLLLCVALIAIILWMYSVFTLADANCKNLKKVYKNELAPIYPISNDPMFDEPLYSFYIKTAYNAASGGNFKNSFVDSTNTNPPFCALKTCLQQGARCLDFEIYSYNHEPVIATSSLDSVFIKETFNYLKFSDAMNYLANAAFDNSVTRLDTDPLFLNFRVMSKVRNNPIYPKMAEVLLSSFGERLLSSEYNLMNSCQNLGHNPLSMFKGKVIVIIDSNTYDQLKIICPVIASQNCSKKTSDTTCTPSSGNSTSTSQNEKLPDSEGGINTSQCQSPNLLEFVNMHSGSPYIHTLRLHELKLADTDQIKYANKTMITMLLPDFDKNADNFNPSIGFSTGCQFIGMSFQNFDVNMEYYSLFFNKAGYAFAYKPALLRFEQLVAPPPPQYPTTTDLNRKALVVQTATGMDINLTAGNPRIQKGWGKYCAQVPIPSDPHCHPDQNTD